jgi:Undecaprenyl-phosphate glucose phosphotransferase
MALMSSNLTSGATALDRATVPLSRKPALHISYRIAIDLLMIVEICAVVASAAISHIACTNIFQDNHQSLQPFLIAGLGGGVVIHYILRSRGLYSIRSVRESWRHLGRIVGAIGLSFIVLLVIAFSLNLASNYSRGWLVTWLGLVLLILPLCRLLWTRVVKWLEASGYTARRVALIVSREPAKHVVDHLSNTPGIRLVGIFVDSLSSPRPDAQPNISDLIDIGQHNGIDEVILSDVSRAHVDCLLEAIDVLPVKVWLCASDVSRPILTTAPLGCYNLLQIRPKPISEWAGLLKMIIDYGIGLLALMIFAPVMAAIAVAIKLDSRGPVFFRQRRHGYNHCVINVFKFRTMRVAEDGERIDQARKDDPRVTRIGKVLRRTSLDELPQLFNVLKGEMSLVGPRPHAVAHNRFYAERIARYAHRHCVKPGITGWAQIKGCRGPTEDLDLMRRRIECDLYYVENWSPLLDLRILVLTPFLGFFNRNAF